MAFGFATAVTGILWPFAGMLIGQMAWLISAIQLGIIQFVSTLPSAAVEMHISVAALLAAYAGIAAFLMLSHRRK